MTKKRILELASEMALMKWSEARKRVSERPDSMIWKAREDRAWQEYGEINEQLKALEAEEDND